MFQSCPEPDVHYYTKPDLFFIRYYEFDLFEATCGHSFKSIDHKSLLIIIDVFLLQLQGEDGFPGFKGDMGIKGDKVRA